MNLYLENIRSDEGCHWSIRLSIGRQYLLYYLVEKNNKYFFVKLKI